MRRGLLLAVVLVLVCLAGACQSDTTDGTPLPPVLQEAELAPPDDLRILADRTRAVVAQSVSRARNDLDAVRAAQRSLRKTTTSLRATLQDALEQTALAGPGEAQVRFQSQLEAATELDDRSARILANIDGLSARVDGFDEWADDVMTQALSESGDDAYHRQALLDLEAEAAELSRTIVVEPRARASDRLVREVGLLSASVDEARRQYRGSAPDQPLVRPSQPETALASSVPPGASALLPNTGDVAEMVTSHGTLVLEFFPELAPRHVENFQRLVSEGFYDNLTFHRIIPGFVVQGGCPLGTGAGGPGYEIRAEFNDEPHRRGTLSMARFAHPDSAGSQFVLCLDDLPELDGKYTVFGRLLRGHDVLEALERTGTVSGRPSEEVKIEKVVLRARRPDEMVGVADASGRR